jgi:hypothetical protein
MPNFGLYFLYIKGPMDKLEVFQQRASSRQRLDVKRITSLSLRNSTDNFCSGLIRAPATSAEVAIHTLPAPGLIWSAASVAPMIAMYIAGRRSLPSGCRPGSGPQRRRSRHCGRGRRQRVHMMRATLGLRTVRGRQLARPIRSSGTLRRAIRCGCGVVCCAFAKTAASASGGVLGTALRSPTSAG